MSNNSQMAMIMHCAELASGGNLGSQNTVASPVTLEGVGLHTGVTVHVRICPAPTNTGIVFKRTDLDGFEIPAQSRFVARVSYATSLMKKGVLISTTEHLLSALAGVGVDNARIEIDNLEVPIMDGSALPFVKALREAGLRPQRSRRLYAKVTRSLEIADGAKRIAVHPAKAFRVTYSIAFPHPVIGAQSLDFSATGGMYDSQIAPARTFGFLAEVEMLLKNGLVKGGSLENVVVLDHEKVMNPEGLRFPDEFCRHKILDLVGDVSLFGHPLIGHVVADRAGHAMHAQLVSQLLKQKDAWKLIPAPEIDAAAPVHSAAELASSGARV
jgi:UDP-3-O-[3-hydroxymyristoyl] N-acetylglucosamine deacetylase